jgi:hypothetical protein
MTLTVRQKSKVRHFIYYLVNGTLDFELIQHTFNERYHQTLKDNPDFFYKTSCVFINQDTKLNPDWPDTKRLGKFICSLYKHDTDIFDFETWETDFSLSKPDYSSDFKLFVKWFTETTVVENITFDKYITDGASFVEQCFAIWTNVIILENNKVVNSEHSIERVKQYIKSYYLDDFIDNLEEWECELYME